MFFHGEHLIAPSDVVVSTPNTDVLIIALKNIEYSLTDINENRTLHK